MGEGGSNRTSSIFRGCAEEVQDTAIYTPFYTLPCTRRHPLAAISSPPFSRRHSHAAIHWPPSAHRHSHAAIHWPPSAHRHSHAAIHWPPCTCRHLLAAMHSPPCTRRHQLTAILSRHSHAAIHSPPSARRHLFAAIVTLPCTCRHIRRHPLAAIRSPLVAAMHWPPSSPHLLVALHAPQSTRRLSLHLLDNTNSCSKRSFYKTATT